MIAGSVDFRLQSVEAFQLQTAYDQLGEIQYREQQRQTAESYFRHAVRLDPKRGTSWFGVAKIYKQEKRFSEALQALSKG
jgi:cytochrome c-type biogenesis protein CcmH/NrfG